MTKVRKRGSTTNGPWTVLGIEGGATQTRAILVNEKGRIVWEGQAGPGNLKLLSDRALGELVRKVRGPIQKPNAVAVGLAGARTVSDKQRIVRVAASVWPGTPIWAGNDLETGLAAGRAQSPHARGWILVLSGTGSCCYGRTRAGQTAKVGGWGHILGDRGSAYDIGLTSVRAVLTEFDRSKLWPRLGERLLRTLILNSPEDLIGWAQHAEKHEVADLARSVFKAWREGDLLAAKVVRQAASELAKDALACAARLRTPREETVFVLAGGVCVGQPRFAQRLRALLREASPRSQVVVLGQESVWGAVELARKLIQDVQTRTSAQPLKPDEIRNGLVEVGLLRSPTEQRNPRSMNLHRMGLETAVALMLREEARVVPALLKERKQLVRAIRCVVSALERGGRLFYVGAGTSGRLGVLDASECPPTFGTPPEMVQGIMAGGARALWESVEGAEDDAVAGAQAVGARGVNGRDVVVGIAASGRTPFVWGALGEARRRRAQTILLCFNPHVVIPKGQRPDLVLAVSVGPEVLTGSTRLKAGTATKLVLNILTTLSMVRMGKVVSNLMVDVRPSNAKLRDRAVRIVRELTGRDADGARQLLEKTGWDVKRAIEIFDF